MKKIAILPLLLAISCAFLSSDSPSQPMDTPRIVTEAKNMTDDQIESTYRQSSTDLVADAVRHNFRELRNLIDSLNTETILALMRADSAAVQRDSAKMVLLGLIADNTKLRVENTQYEREVRIISLAPDILYLFLVVLFGSLLSQGIFTGFVNRKTANEK